MGNPGDEDDLASVIANKSQRGHIPVSCRRHLEIERSRSRRRGNNAPLALTATKVVLDVVDSETGHGGAVGVLSRIELAAEDLVVLVVANLVDNNALLVIGDLVDDELGLALAQTELVECSDALILNLNTAYRLSISRSGGG